MSTLQAEAPRPAQDELIASIRCATEHEQIFKALPPLGLQAIAERLEYLHRITADPDPNEPPMTLSSLRQCALFFAGEPDRRDADLGIGPDGLVEAEWRGEIGNLLAVEFLPSGSLRCAAVAESSVPGEPWRISGTLPNDHALRAMKPFFADRSP